MITSRYLHQFILKHSSHRSLSQIRQYVMKRDSTVGLILTVNSFNWCKVKFLLNLIRQICAFRCYSRRETTRDVLCTSVHTNTHTHTHTHTQGVPGLRESVLMLKYTDITQNTYVQIWTVTEIMAREVWNFDSCYTLIDYQVHIKTGRNMWFL